MRVRRIVEPATVRGAHWRLGSTAGVIVAVASAVGGIVVWGLHTSSSSPNALSGALWTYSVAVRGAAAPANATVVVTVTLAVLMASLLFWRFQHAQQAAEILTAEREALARSERRFRALVSNASEVILIVDQQGIVQYESPATSRLWGYRSDTLVGRGTLDLVHPADIGAARLLLTQAMAMPGVNVRSEVRLQHHDGSWQPSEIVMNNLVAEPAVSGIVLTCHDITERKGFERELVHQAFHDPLTSLANRVLFLDRTEHALARSDRANNPVTMFYLDLDNFKVINDSLGHRAGDVLLTAFAERLLGCVRLKDTVARLGGDEFAILLEDGQDLDEASAVAERVTDVLRQPFAIEGHVVYTTCSIGIAVSRGKEDAGSLLRDADLALYRAKAEGKARYALFDASMERDAIERLDFENDLRDALAHDELRIHYQPILSLDEDRIVEVEALVRWQHPRLGLIPPDKFIPIAEETGLIVPVGRWVLDTACHQLRRWQMASRTCNPLQLSVNVSGRQLWARDFVAQLEGILADTGIDPSTLTLELTESMVLTQNEATLPILERIKELGVKLAIDDFGTGYASLSYVKGLPFDLIKIDRSFVEGLDQRPENRAIVRNIIELARALSLGATGEGIETVEQLTELRELGCDRAQGFYFARPLTADGIDELFAEPIAAAS